MSTAESAIRELLEKRVAAVRNKDVEGLIAGHAEDFVAFDVINPLQSNGLNALRLRAEQWLSSFSGPMGYELRDLTVAASDEVAFCHFLNGIDAMKKDGGRISMWWRVTVCLKKIDGHWLITHEHDSVPFDMETGTASLSLTP